MVAIKNRLTDAYGGHVEVVLAVGMQWKTVSYGRGTTLVFKLTILKMFVINACN